ncbi:MAG: hypothetical protein NZ519_11090 [Bacteroidia bacterium]|nr:hypothetical protein [Bacteroidia bacterium]MDW8302317.1 hypothetical protein [Bacteroidia bacterium]
MRATKKQLQNLENEVEALGYTVRYEKGNFNGGYCVVKQTKVVVVNKFFSLEGKIAVLHNIIEQIKADIAVQNALQEDKISI